MDYAPGYCFIINNTLLYELMESIIEDDADKDAVAFILATDSDEYWLGFYELLINDLVIGEYDDFKGVESIDELIDRARNFTFRRPIDIGGHILRSYKTSDFNNITFEEVAEINYESRVDILPEYYKKKDDVIPNLFLLVKAFFNEILLLGYSEDGPSKSVTFSCIKGYEAAYINVSYHYDK